MEKLASIGRIFFAVAMIGLGIEHFVFADFVTGRAPAWPEWLPGGALWAYLTGGAFVAMSLAILVGKEKARTAALLAGALIFLWAFLRHIPVVAAASILSGEWTSAGKALTLSFAAVRPTRIGVSRRGRSATTGECRDGQCATKGAANGPARRDRHDGLLPVGSSVVN